MAIGMSRLCSVIPVPEIMMKMGFLGGFFDWRVFRASRMVVVMSWQTVGSWKVGRSGFGSQTAAR